MTDTTVLANPAPMSSVELSQTAKGLTHVKVQCYAADVAEAGARATTALYDQLVSRYATGDGDASVRR